MVRQRMTSVPVLEVKILPTPFSLSVMADDWYLTGPHKRSSSGKKRDVKTPSPVYYDISLISEICKPKSDVRGPRTNDSGPLQSMAAIQFVE